MADTNDLLRQQLGQTNGGVIFSSAAQTGKDCFAVQFLKESVISNLASDLANPAEIYTTIPAGTIIFGKITAITLTQGVAIGYSN